MRVDDIEPKYLVLGNGYDDFSLATDKVDFSQEDLCSYLTSLTNVIYWLTTESVWGPLGFQWTSGGTNGRPGYGVFNQSTIDFSVIPKIPDSYRHTKLDDIFSKLNFNKDITFLDSGWGHIKTFNSLFRNTFSGRLIWHLGTSLKNSGATISNKYTNTSCYNTKYELHGELDGVKVDYVNLYVVADNCKKLMIDITDSVYLYLYFDDIEGSDLNFENYFINRMDSLRDVRDSDYVWLSDTVVNKIKTYTASTNQYKSKNNYVPFCYNFSLNRGYENIILDKVTKKINPDIYQNVSPLYLSHEERFHTKSIEYVGLDFNKLPKLTSFYCRMYLEEIPEVTDEIYNSCNCVFSGCIFLGDYKYGKLKADSKTFSACTHKYDDTDITSEFREVYNNYGKPEIKEIKNLRNIHDLSKHLDFELVDYDEGNTQSFCVPTIFVSLDSYSTSPIICLVNKEDFKIYPSNSYVYNIGGDTYWFKTQESISSYLTLHEYGRNIISNNCQYNDVLYYSYKIHGETLYSSDRVIFETTRENVAEFKTVLVNPTYYIMCHDWLNEQTKLINRHSMFTIHSSSNNVSTNLMVQALSRINSDTELIVYNSTITIGNPSTDVAGFAIEDSKIYKILDSIVTVGNSTDSAGITISLYTRYYLGMNSETKERLLRDGYTIIEVI